MEIKKVNIPQKGAPRKWAQRLKKLGEQTPPRDLMDKINRKDDTKKVASPSKIHDELEN